MQDSWSSEDETCYFLTHHRWEECKLWHITYTAVRVYGVMLVIYIQGWIGNILGPGNIKQSGPHKCIYKCNSGVWLRGLLLSSVSNSKSTQVFLKKIHRINYLRGAKLQISLPKITFLTLMFFIDVNYRMVGLWCRVQTVWVHVKVGERQRKCGSETKLFSTADVQWGVPVFFNGNQTGFIRHTVCVAQVNMHIYDAHSSKFIECNSKWK